MLLHLDPTTVPPHYKSPSQKTRVMTEAWTHSNMYCPNCGNLKLSQFPNNKAVADFFCAKCSDEYELKAKKGKVGKTIVSSDYATMIARLHSNTNPNLFFLSYTKSLEVKDFFGIPKYFFIPEIIEKRKPLPPSNKRAGWVGSNILFHLIPKVGIIDIIVDGQILLQSQVLNQWQQTLFMQGTKDLKARSWLLDIILEIEKLNKKDFTLAEIYKAENTLKSKHPENNHIRDKIRQQLQVLRDKKYLDFMSPGNYRLI
jgi:type II restriction enzyme